MTNPTPTLRPCCGMTDVHTHVVPERFPAYVGKHLDARWPSTAPAHACHQHVMLAGSVYRTVSHQCWSSSVRLSDMDTTGVTRQVLSPMPELLSYWLAPEDGVAMCRFLNETIAGMVSAQPQRFVGLGAVPLQDVDAAIRELEIAVREFKLAGVEIGGNVEGTVIGDAKFSRFFAAAEQLGASIFVHPLRPSGADRLIGPAALEQVLAFPGETGLAAASLITGGTFAAHPGLRIAFSHGGGSFQALLPRLQHGWETFPVLKDKIALEPRAAARRFYYDSLVYDRATLAHLLHSFGDTQLMVGTDYPFLIMDKRPGDTLAALGLSPEVEARLHSGNAERWLGLA